MLGGSVSESELHSINRGAYSSPNRFIRLKNVLRGTPSRRAASALFPPALARASTRSSRPGSGIGLVVDCPRGGRPRRRPGTGWLAGIRLRVGASGSQLVWGIPEITAVGSSASVKASPSARTTARSIAFSSSRIFPGQGYLRSASMAPSSRWLTRLPALSVARARK